MSRCFFCQAKVEISREALSNACARCSAAQYSDPAVAFDRVAPALRNFRDVLLFGDTPISGQFVDSSVMERARRAKWDADEGSAEQHRAAYWYSRLFAHNAALSRARAAIAKATPETVG